MVDEPETVFHCVYGDIRRCGEPLASSPQRRVVATEPRNASGVTNHPRKIPPIALPPFVVSITCAGDRLQKYLWGILGAQVRPLCPHLRG